MTDTPKTDDEKESPEDVLASRLIDAWCADKGRQIPWAKAIQIVAIVTKQSDNERDRLLHLGDDDGSCEMCGRNAIALEAELLRLRGMEQDAKRYRFVRIPGQLFRLIRLMAENRWNTSDQLDTAIDKALAATQCARTEAEQ